MHAGRWRLAVSGLGPAVGSGGRVRSACGGVTVGGAGVACAESGGGPGWDGYEVLMGDFLHPQILWSQKKERNFRQR